MPAGLTEIALAIAARIETLPLFFGGGHVYPYDPTGLTITAKAPLAAVQLPVHYAGQPAAHFNAPSLGATTYFVPFSIVPYPGDGQNGQIQMRDFLSIGTPNSLYAAFDPETTDTSLGLTGVDARLVGAPIVVYLDKHLGTLVEFLLEVYVSHG